MTADTFQGTGTHRRSGGGTSTPVRYPIHNRLDAFADPYPSSVSILIALDGRQSGIFSSQKNPLPTSFTDAHLNSSNGSVVPKQNNNEPRGNRNHGKITRKHGKLKPTKSGGANV